MKNERAFIVFLSYVIGFTTAFIGYGLSGEFIGDGIAAVAPSATQVASVAAVSTEQYVAKVSQVPVSTADLTMTKDGETRLIAVSRTSAPELGEAAYAAVFSSSQSPDQEYLFYCATSTTEAVSCDPYVYSWMENAIHPVTLQGERVTFAPDTLNVTWANNGTLVLEQWRSDGTPWTLQ